MSISLRRYVCSRSISMHSTVRCARFSSLASRRCVCFRVFVCWAFALFCHRAFCVFVLSGGVLCVCSFMCLFVRLFDFVGWLMVWLFGCLPVPFFFFFLALSAEGSPEYTTRRLSLRAQETTTHSERNSK